MQSTPKAPILLRRFFNIIAHVFALHRGRPLAVLFFLLVSTHFLLGSASPLYPISLSWFDQLQRWGPRERVSAPVVIVDVDEASLKRWGQWPWSRKLVAELVTKINNHQPAAIGLDFYMPEPDKTSPEVLAQSIEDAKLREQLASLPRHDDLLANVLSRTSSVLGAAGLDMGTESSTQQLVTAGFREIGEDARPYLRSYSNVLASLPQLQKSAAGQALVSVDIEQHYVYQVPLIYALGTQLVSSFSVELFRVAQNAPVSWVRADGHGVSEVGVGDLKQKTNDSGSIWIRYGYSDASRYLSAADVLENRLDSEQLRQRFVIVGLSGIGLVDQRQTPLNEIVPGAEIQAQIVENLFDGTAAIRHEWFFALEFFGFALLAVAIICFLPVVSFRRSFLFSVALATLLVAGSAGAFAQTGVLIDTATPITLLLLICASMIASGFVEAARSLAASEAALIIQREVSARYAGELATARKIQLESLPTAASLNDEEPRIEVAALLEPAREVGGDLYDFFKLDDDRVLFLVGDVAGKGLPASLFMVMTKALAKSIALRGKHSLAALVNTTNEELSRDNPENFFVTLLIGIINTATGVTELCSAGHDAPWLLRSDGSWQRLDCEGGPPLCVFPEFSFATSTLQLKLEDVLCLVTDGATEALNPNKTLFGTGRIDAICADNTKSAPQVVLNNLREAIREFVAGAEPADDLTLLMLKWQKPLNS